MDDEENGIIRLVSKDGDVFELSERAANLSELIQDSPREEDEEVTKLDIARVNSACLKKVVEFLKHYDEEKMTDIPTPLGGSSFNEVCPTFYALCPKQLFHVLFGNQPRFLLLLNLKGRWPSLVSRLCQG